MSTGLFPRATVHEPCQDSSEEGWIVKIPEGSRKRMPLPPPNAYSHPASVGVIRLPKMAGKRYRSTTSGANIPDSERHTQKFTARVPDPILAEQLRALSASGVTLAQVLAWGLEHPDCPRLRLPGK